MAQPSQMKTPEARALRGEMEPDFLRAQREQSPQNSPRTQREQSPQSFFRAQRENDQSSNLKPSHVPTYDLFQEGGSCKRFFFCQELGSLRG